MTNVPLHRVGLKTRLVFGALWAISGYAVSSLAALASTALLVRLVDPSVLGSYFLIISIVTVGAGMLQLGLGRSSLRLIAKSLATDNVVAAWDIARRSLLLLSISAILGSAVFYVYGIDYASHQLFDAPELASLKIPIIVLTIFFAFRNVIVEIFRGFHDIRTAVSLGDPQTRIIFMLLLGALWIFSFNVSLFSIITIMIACVSIPASAGLVKLYTRSRAIEIRSSIAYKEILHISIPLLLVNMTSIILAQTNIWVIGSFLTQDDVAIYGSAMRLVLLLSAPLLIVNTVIPPMISDLHSKGELKRLESLLRATATMTLIPSLLVLIVFILFGRQVLEIIYSPYYAQGHWILVILCLGQISAVWVGLSATTLMMTGHHREIMVITLIGTALLITGSILAVTWKGTTGVAIVNALVLLIINLTGLFITKKKLGIWSHAGISYIRKSYFQDVFRLITSKLK